MKIERFTDKAREAISEASEIAKQHNHGQIEVEHLLDALRSQGGGVVQQVIQKVGGSDVAAKRIIENEIERLPRVYGANDPGISPRLRKVLEDAWREMRNFKDEYLSVEHLLLGMFDADSDAVKRALKATGLTRDNVLKALTSIRGAQRVTDQNPEVKYQALEKYGRNLTELAEQGKLDPVIGRDEEIRRVIQVLSRRTKNNPVLIGDPGVGKTAIAEVHTIVGAGAAEGAIDAANLLKPMLARGELRAIGATTLDEYRKHIEKDAALERRFQPVLVDQPSVEDTISILRGLRERYEVHHGVRIKDAALVAAAVLSNRYITDRFLPDKAIDLVDEAAAKLRTEIDSLPTELDDISRRVMQLEIERQALKKESDRSSKDRLAGLEKNLAELSEKRTALRSRWNQEKEAIAKIRSLKAKLEEVRTDAERAERAADFAKAAELRYGKAVEIEKQLEEANRRLGQL